jgi:hypothetical protein
MKCHRLCFLASLAAGIVACGETTPEIGSAHQPDASPEATPEACTSVRHGGACSTEGATTCGTKRSCTDVETDEPTTCTCRSGRYDCGSCPACSADLRGLGCGVGQVCDGVTFTQCDGTTSNVNATCTCFGGTWSCGDAGLLSYCTEDGGHETGAEPDACAAPVTHGGSCAAEGATACGFERMCGDVDTGRRTTCTCRNGRYFCGSCPSCTSSLRALNCGIGQVCDGLTLGLCDNTSVTIPGTCRCHFGSPSSWECEGDDGGKQTYLFCRPDAGTD